jgi:hypothetical protein
MDTPLPSVHEPIPNDFNNLHFGAGETEVKVKLPLRSCVWGTISSS